MSKQQYLNSMVDKQKAKVVILRFSFEEGMAINDAAKMDGRSVNSWCKRILLNEISRPGVILVKRDVAGKFVKKEK